ncbi:MAG: NADH-quinone oxidoreductase subunit NuoK [Chloroflexi bacterium]|nr:NADH-quinone oxidoreductase subunit NuoK [Chloroflexota bacterium]MBU1749244.1 NADH-quinone oxidoreductase subunit NuoK [Chloroflexota bacterium]MBU1877672.1 NADH-quinone oxidoreductase subunit NuoK [Chloroflexota bacterium]
MPLNWYLLLAAALFCIGIYAALSRRNAIGILMGVELMLNAVNINLVAFWRYITPQQLTGQVFVLFIIAIAAAEAVVGLALVISLYRRRETIFADEVDLLQG